MIYIFGYYCFLVMGLSTLSLSLYPTSAWWVGRGLDLIIFYLFQHLDFEIGNSLVAY